MIAIILLDQISKAWVLDNLVYGESIQPIPALYPFFQFTRSSNTGAAFGMLPSAGNAFLVVSVLISAFLIYLYRQTTPKVGILHVGLSLVLGGAVGNAIDRLQHGHVVDFFHITIPSVVSNVSNFADHAIVLGVILIMIDSFISPNADPTPAKDPTTEDTTP